MSTTMAAPTGPDTKTLEAQRAARVARRDVLAGESNTIFQMLSSYAVHEGPTPGTHVDRLRARAREPEVTRDLALIDAEIAEIDAALRVAHDEERRDRRAAFHARKKPLVVKLDRALQAAAAINQALADLEAAEVASVGDVPQLAWHELMDETPIAASRLASWRRHARSHELLDD